MIRAQGAFYAQCAGNKGLKGRLCGGPPRLGWGVGLLCLRLQTMQVIGGALGKPYRTSNATAATIYHVIDAVKPTFLIDEADTFLKGKDDLRGVLNSGHDLESAHVSRLERDKDGWHPRLFSTFCPIAIAMIGSLPDTLADRSIHIRLHRSLPTENIAHFRADRASDLRDLARKMARWGQDHFDELSAADPQMPASLHNRRGDNWRSLFGIADAIGGMWPQRLRRIAETATADTDGESAAILLLQDIARLFEERIKEEEERRIREEERAKRRQANIGDGKIQHCSLWTPEDPKWVQTGDMMHYMAAQEDRPWGEWHGRKPITARDIGGLLRPFGIRSRNHEYASGRVKKGYCYSDFKDAIARYTLHPEIPDTETTPTEECDENDNENCILADNDGRAGECQRNDRECHKGEFRKQEGIHRPRITPDSVDEDTEG